MGWEALAYGLEPQWLLWVKGEDVALMRAQIDGSGGKNKPCATPQREEEFSYPTAFFFKWSILKEGGIASWKEGCCVVGCIGHLLSSANLLSSYKDSASCLSSISVWVPPQEEIWVWEPPATRLVCRQDDVVLLGIESAV